MGGGLQAIFSKVLRKIIGRFQLFGKFIGKKASSGNILVRISGKN